MNDSGVRNKHECNCMDVLKCPLPTIQATSCWRPLFLCPNFFYISWCHLHASPIYTEGNPFLFLFSQSPLYFYFIPSSTFSASISISICTSPPVPILQTAPCTSASSNAGATAPHRQAQPRRASVSPIRTPPPTRRPPQCTRWVRKTRYCCRNGSKCVFWRTWCIACGGITRACMPRSSVHEPRAIRRRPAKCSPRETGWPGVSRIMSDCATSPPKNWGNCNKSCIADGWPMLVWNIGLSLPFRSTCWRRDQFLHFHFSNLVLPACTCLLPLLSYPICIFVMTSCIDTFFSILNPHAGPWTITVAHVGDTGTCGPRASLPRGYERSAIPFQNGHSLTHAGQSFKRQYRMLVLRIYIFLFSRLKLNYLNYF